MKVTDWRSLRAEASAPWCHSSGANMTVAHTVPALATAFVPSSHCGEPPLCVCCRCDNPKARAHAEGALVRLSIENANRVLIIKQLVSMLTNDGSTGAAAKKAEKEVKAVSEKLEKDKEEKKTLEGKVRDLPHISRTPSLIHGLC